MRYIHPLVNKPHPHPAKCVVGLKTQAKLHLGQLGVQVGSMSKQVFLESFSHYVRTLQTYILVPIQTKFT